MVGHLPLEEAILVRIQVSEPNLKADPKGQLLNLVVVPGFEGRERPAGGRSVRSAPVRESERARIQVSEHTHENTQTPFYFFGLYSTFQTNPFFTPATAGNR